MKKKLSSVLAASLVLSGFLGTVQAKAASTATPDATMANPFQAEMKVVEKFSDGNDVEALFSQNLFVEKKGEDGKPGELKQYFKFNLEEESWVYFAPNFSLNEHDGLRVDYQIYNDKAFSNFKVGVGTGYFNQFNEEESVVLPAGEYYGYAYYKHENFDDFKGNVNLRAFAIPVTKVLVAEQTLAKKKNKVNISLSSKIDEKTLFIQARPGKLGADSIGNNKYWLNHDSLSSTTLDEKVTKLEMNDDNEYNFTVKKNGYYSFLVYDSLSKGFMKPHQAVLKTIKVHGIDDVRPKISGVKNGKTYKKSVTFKFSDKGTGIASAELNGKKVKSGTKLTKSGNYTLVVKDKAGNVRKVNFKVK